MSSQKHIVIGIGELLWDCFPDGKHPGGAPANVAYHTRQLGGKGIILSRVGDDELGRELIDYLASKQVTTDYIQVDPHHPTGTVTIEAVNPAQPHFKIHEGVAWDYLDCMEQWQDAAASASVICFGTLAQRSEGGRIAIRQCMDAASGAVRVYDVNLRPPFYNMGLVCESLDLAHVVKLNHDEMNLVGSHLGTPADDVQTFALELIDRFDVQIVCITRGGRGCVLVDREQRIEVPGRDIRVVDTVGSGDAFTAAFIHGLLCEWPLTRCAKFANSVGALVAGQQGAMPNLAGQYDVLIGELA